MGRMKKLILFIHGLGGDSRKTWGKFPVLIEKDNDLSKNYYVGYYSFPTSLFRLPFQKKYPKIQQLAEGLKTQIENKFNEYQEIALVCHSLGGLIGRKYILEEIKSGNELKISKLLLFATPNNGAQLASIANLIAYKHNQLKQLCKNSDFIEFLNEDWFKLNTPDCIHIKYVIAGLDKIVDTQSAKNFWGNSNTETIVEKTHKDVVKPEGKNDLSFLILKKFLLVPSPKEEEEIEIEKSLSVHLKSQIEKQKKIKKYIPEVFTEITDIKERIRYFVDPVLFWNKVIEDLERLDFRLFINFLNDYEVGKFEFLLPDEYKRQLKFEEIPIIAKKLKQFLLKKIDELKFFESRDAWGIDKVPKRKEYFYNHQKYYLYSSFYKWKLEIIVEYLDSFVSGSIIITAPAGHGKTNLLCDLGEKVLLKRSINCLFFTANELNDIDLDNIGNFFLKRVFKGLYDKSWRCFLETCRRIFKSSNKPLVIVIDALNEHRNIHSFSEKLLQFTEEILQYEFIKVLYTCRSEYFNERFSNFNNSPISSEILFIKNFDNRIEDEDREMLLEAYFSFYKINYNFIIEEVFRKLTDDPLLLRIFCEAYADVERKKATFIPELRDLYKESIFRKYLKKKEEEINKKRTAENYLNIQKGSIFKKILESIVQYMIDEKRFFDIPIDEMIFSGNELNELARIIDEDILLRKDLKVNEIDKSALYESIETINFTFDEFRDYLIADNLIFFVFKKNIDNFELMIDDIFGPQVSVSEGVRKFLFYISKRLKDDTLDRILEKRDWYDALFFKEIFSVDDDFIQLKDISKIEKKFLEGGESVGYIIKKFLYYRWNHNAYPNLNIRLLFDWIQNVYEDFFQRNISPLFIDKGYYGGREVKIHSEDLFEVLSNMLERIDFNEREELHNIFEFLIIMMGADLYIATYAHDLFRRYALKYIEHFSHVVYRHVVKIKILKIVSHLCLIIEELLNEGQQVPNRFFTELFDYLKKKPPHVIFTRADSYIIDLLMHVSNSNRNLFVPEELQFLRHLSEKLDNGGDE